MIYINTVPFNVIMFSSVLHPRGTLFIFISCGHCFHLLKMLVYSDHIDGVFPYSSGYLNGSLHHLLKEHHSFMSHHAEKQFSRYCLCSLRVTSHMLSES